MPLQDKSNSSIIRSQRLMINKIKDFTSKRKVLLVGKTIDRRSVGELFLNNTSNSIPASSKRGATAARKNPVQNEMAVSKKRLKKGRTGKPRNRKRNP